MKRNGAIVRGAKFCGRTIDGEAGIVSRERMVAGGQSRRIGSELRIGPESADATRPRVCLADPCSRTVVGWRRLGRGEIEVELACGHAARRKFLRIPERCICDRCNAR